MNENEKDNPGQDSSGLSRRLFLGTVGAAALGAGALRELRAEDETIYGVDSFGNTLPAAQDAVAAGVLPAPVNPEAPNAAGRRQNTSPMDDPAGTFSGHNILMILVDQLRQPKWLPPGGVDGTLQNIALLRNHSFVFSNYFTAADACSPARATLLTGLYSQQTCMFQTLPPSPNEQMDASVNQPDLNTGFSTFADAVATQGFDACWIGKWHLSNSGSGVGEPGVAAYRFNEPGSYPGPGDPSPDGIMNEGTDGHFPMVDFSPGTANPGYTPTYKPVNDPYICRMFINWLTSTESTKWFCAVSFVNPHDITAFPFGFDLDSTCPAPPLYTCRLSSTPPAAYAPPPVTGEDLTSLDITAKVPALTNLYTSAPAGWNESDGPTPYGTTSGKPDLQTYFQTYLQTYFGGVSGPLGYVNFLNYYVWMQAAVDYEIGLVMKNLQTLAPNTTVIFASDHGDYGGSHGLHAKGGALYEEAINVPLYVSFPSQRTNYAIGDGSVEIDRAFTCSSVDIFPLIYSLASGTQSIFLNPSDPYHYLKSRESILDSILFGSMASQRRVSPSTGQPYVLHTTDEFTQGTLPDGVTPIPTHAIAYRTPTGKLGMYMYWPPCSTQPSPQLGAAGCQAQYEFYNYSAGNTSELLNDGIASYNAATEFTTLTAAAQGYLNDFISPGVQNELYGIDPAFLSAHHAALTAYLGASC